MYALATKLSSESMLTHATVLTEDKVMVTEGLGTGQIMKLVDWLIIAGKVIHETPQAPPPQAPQAPPPSTHPIGTKLRWQSIDDYRVAIMTNNGVLQVKSVEGGMTSTKKIIFTDEAAWRASLPSDEITVTDTRTVIQKRLEDPLDCSRDFSHVDADKLYEYMKRFKILTTVLEAPSPNSKLQDALVQVEKCRAELNNITLKDEMLGKIRHKLNLRLYRFLRFYSQMKSYTSSLENPDKKPVKMTTYGKSFLRTVIKGIEYEVGVKGDRLMHSQIAIREALYFWKPVQLFNSFKDMGNPKFYIIYRRKRYDLNL